LLVVVVQVVSKAVAGELVGLRYRVASKQVALELLAQLFLSFIRR
jgi:hypothetical protein